MRMVTVCLLIIAVIGFSRDTALGDWPGAFLWSICIGSAAGVLVAMDAEAERKREEEHDHDRQ